MEKEKHERVELLKAMNLIACHLIDEEIAEEWFFAGIGQGALEGLNDEEIAKAYCENDEEFAEIMLEFEWLMRKVTAPVDLLNGNKEYGGALACGKIQSAKYEEEEERR